MIIPVVFAYLLFGCIHIEEDSLESNKIEDVNNKRILDLFPIHKERPEDNYNNIVNCDSDTPLLVLSNNTKKCLIDETGHQINTKTYDLAQPSQHSKIGLTAVKLNDKWGFINHKGKEIIAPKYDVFIFYSDGVTAVVYNKKVGFINEYGKELVSPQYDNFRRLLDGTIFTLLDKKYGLISQDFTTTVKPTYDAINFGDGMSMSNMTAAVSNGKHGFINREGKVMIPFEYDYIQITLTGYYLVQKNDKWGYISRENEVIVPVKYTEEEAWNELKKIIFGKC